MRMRRRRLATRVQGVRVAGGVAEGERVWDYQGIGSRVAHPMRKKGMQLATVQGYLAHKKQCPPRPLQ